MPRSSTIAGVARRIINMPKVLNMKDERELRNKDVQSTIIAKIINYLDNCQNRPPFNYEDARFLRVPSTTEFTNVFVFIVQNIQPAFQLVRIESESGQKDLISFMKNLGYPYPLKPSLIKSATAPSSWPSMLPILDWLVDVVEVEEEVFTENKIGDLQKWSLLGACHQHMQEIKSNNPGAVETEIDYDQEFDAYKRIKMEENEGEADNYEEMRANRAHFEEELKLAEIEMGEEKSDITRTERLINDLKADMESLNKYMEDLAVKTAQNDQIMIQENQDLEVLVSRIEQLNREKQDKERLIGAQKISGSEARKLVSERNACREELAMLRNRYSEEENKTFKQEPEFSKLSAKVRSDFKTLVFGLKSLCEMLQNSEEANEWIDSLNSYSFEKAFADIQRSRTENKLVQLVCQLKQQANQKKIYYKRTEETADQVKANLLKEIREAESLTEQERTQRKLDIERAKRERDDKMRPTRDQKHSLDLVMSRRNALVEELNKFTAQYNKLHEELADKHMTLVQFKQRLDNLYSELQTLVLEKMAKLSDRSQQIRSEKERLKEVGEHILRENLAAIEQLKAAKRGRKPAK